MGKAKTFKKQKKSSAISSLPTLSAAGRKTLSKAEPAKYLTDRRNIELAIFECIRDGDAESLLEVLNGFYEAIDVKKRIEITGLPRRTLFHALSEDGNPNLATAMKLIHGALAY